VFGWLRSRPKGTAGVGNAALALSRVRGPRAAPVERPMLTRNGKPSKDTDPKARARPSTAAPRDAAPQV
jgi:hypothetical protein